MGMNTVLHYTDATTNKPQNIVGSSGAAWSRPKYGTGEGWLFTKAISRSDLCKSN